jgi:anthranilate synthase/aminodeoxychorismate synthase-like glutamine amidotransferase
MPHPAVQSMFDPLYPKGLQQYWRADFFSELNDQAVHAFVEHGSRVPTLGVCLGHQAIVEAFGGEIGQAHRLLHGKASAVSHDGRGIFEGLPDPLEGGRYHSLAATRVPEELEVCATADDGEVMAVRHRELPVVGIQFHPESVLTPDGPMLGRNFLEGKR